MFKFLEKVTVLIPAQVAVLVCLSLLAQVVRESQAKLHSKSHPWTRRYSPFFDVENDLKARKRREIKIVTNKTLQDHHKYYSAEFYPEGHQLWNDLREKETSVLDTYLSSNLLAVKDVNLSFEFPYYGHFIKTAILTTGGFIYLGSSKNRHIAGFQYVAPLVAYFDPSLNNSGVAVHHYDSGNEFIVQWSNVHLHDNVQAGSFTFQCILNRTGEIIFSYQKIAIPVANISSAAHAVKVGISDAYYVDKLKHYYGIWRIYRTFYEYNNVDINKGWVGNGTAILLRPKPNCISARSCEDCITRRLSGDFNCTWCNRLSRCSDGFDRHRVEWINLGCNTSGNVQLENCVVEHEPVLSPPLPVGLAPWLLAVVCCFAVVLLTSAVWLAYAVTHPTSKSGLCLIQYGPGNCCKESPNTYQETATRNSSVFNKVLT